jgi:hypothetical protein
MLVSTEFGSETFRIGDCSCCLMAECYQVNSRPRRATAPASFATEGSGSIVGADPYQSRPHAPSVSYATQVAFNRFTLRRQLLPVASRGFFPRPRYCAKDLVNMNRETFRPRWPSKPSGSSVYLSPPSDVVNGSFVPFSLDKTTTEH